MAVEIILARGQISLIDEADFDLVSNIKWFLTEGGYARGWIKGIGGIRMHRLILGMTKGDKLEVDHINGNRLDNRRTNLRICSRVENSRNTKLSPRNTSGYKGVVWSKRYQRFASKIVHLGKTHFLGFYDTAKEAHAAYCAKAIELHGEFANFGDNHV